MYNDFFRFRQPPFSIAPDPGFLYLGHRHREALAHLMYGLKTDGGFVLITGEVGTGKTTLIRSVIDQVPEGLDVAFILNPRLTVKELLETLCDELRVEYRRGEVLTGKHYIDLLNRHLLAGHARGRSTVMVIDEAQNLPPAVLEQIRLLTNLETNNRKLLRIILVGQPELDAVLERADMRQLAQRITARCHLTALDKPQTRAYVAHRLTLAGGHPGLITSAAQRELYRLSGGVPRLVNIIADRALLGAYVENRLTVNRRVVRNAAREIGGQAAASTRWLAPALAAALITTAAATWAWFNPMPDMPPWLAGVGSPDVAAAVAADDTAAAAQDDDPAPADNVNGNPPVPDATAAAPVHQEQYRIITPDARIELTDDWQDAAAGPAGDFDAPDALEPRIIRPQRAVPDAGPRDIPADADSSASAPNPVTALGRPPGMSTRETQRYAFEAVFHQWDRHFDNGDLPCNIAPRVGLQCLRREGGWSELARINHPAVLELSDGGGRPYYAALLQQTGNRLQLQLGNRIVTTSLDALGDNWLGSYVVLWEMPPSYQGSVRLGDDQVAVGWLRQQLTQLLAVDLRSQRPTQFDADLDEALRAFQRDNGLVEDGIAGPATWMAISTLIGDVPRLDAGDEPEVYGARRSRRQPVSMHDAARDLE